ncbi:MAG TPA: CBO0543 family protein [Desulfosporosinus sp.]|nr:CBO0543 family protein [Desulfosporosinus sp.]
MFTIPGVEHANDLLHEANVILLKTWIEQIVFTWRWWLEVSISIISWVYFWFFLRKKPDTYRLICAGFFSMVVSTYLDTVGMAMRLWGYPSKEIPLMPPFITWDLCVIPVMTMIVLHYKPNINPLIKSIVLGVFGSLILQPIAQLLGLYSPYRWPHLYSIPMAMMIYLGSNYFYNEFSFRRPKPPKDE